MKGRAHFPMDEINLRLHPPASGARQNVLGGIMGFSQERLPCKWRTARG